MVARSTEVGGIGISQRTRSIGGAGGNIRKNIISRDLVMSVARQFCGLSVSRRGFMDWRVERGVSREAWGFSGSFVHKKFASVGPRHSDMREWKGQRRQCGRVEKVSVAGASGRCGDCS